MRLSLRWKISAGFAILLGLVGILAWVTIAQFTSLRAVQRQVFNDAVPGLVAVDEIVRSYTAQQASVGLYLAAEPGALEQYRSEVRIAEIWEGRAEELFTDPAEEVLLEDLTRAGNEFQAVVDRVVELVSDGKRSQAIRVVRAEGTPAITEIGRLGGELVDQQGEVLLEDLTRAGNEFQAVVDRVVELVSDGKRSQAIRVVRAEGTPAITEIGRLGGELVDQQGEVLQVTESEVDRRSNQTIVILVAVTIGALLAGVALAIALPRRLSANLALLVDAARAVERGNFEQELDIRSGDEVEELAQRFVEMQSGLKKLQQLALQDRELEIAADIQQRLLQRKLPEVEGVRVVPSQRQANRVGGDWYDVDAGGRWLTVAIGDASGKGIAAALMATVMLSSLRAERSRGAGPKRVIEQANLALLEATDAGAFTTCVYATVDTVTGEVRWLNMGHPSPFLLHAPDGEVRGYYVEGPHNRALGWYENPGLDQTSVTLAAGDRLILFTDGFIEAKAPDGEVFGERRLETSLLELASLPSDALAAQVVEDVERFAAGKLDDDLTMLVIEFEGAAVAPIDPTLVLSERGAGEPDELPPASRLGAAAEPE